MKKILKYSLLLFILLLIPITTVNAKEKTLGQWKTELNKIQKQLEDTNNKKAQNQKDIDNTNSRINSIYSQMEKINNDIDKKTKESEQLEKDIDKKNNETKDLMRYYQVSSSGSSMLEYIMGAESLTDLIYRLSITEQISNYNKKVVEEMNSMIKENDKIKTELASKKDELASLQSELNTQVAKLNETKASLNDEGHSQEESIKEMKNTIKYLEGLGCKDSETQTSCLNRKYSHKNNGSSGGSGGSYLPSGTTFYRPTSSGRISSEYGWRTLYGKPNLHAAIDISTPIGTTVYAVAPGYVAKTIRSNSGGGNQIIIHHLINGRYYTSYYCHLSAFNVSVGQIVTKDTVIGKSGNTGNSTGPHLHLGLANGRWYADYYSYYGNNGFIGHSFNPRNAIVFPAKGQSYYNR